MSTKNNRGETITAWQNHRPSSTTYCRPIKMQFLKETKEVSKREKNDMDKEIQGLVDTMLLLTENISVFVKHELFMIIVDGKIINSIFAGRHLTK